MTQGRKSDRQRGVTPPLSVAPMMQRTDRHFRRMMRLITRETLLYTEMVTTGAVLHGDRERLLGYDEVEHPIALQLGGDDPKALSECAQVGVDWGYDEINLNVGCPSDRVQNGCFGASLMRRPERVAAAVEAMRARVDVPVTVKHRIGVDELDRYDDMLRFVDIVSEADCDRFSVHARKAWLNGLSPKENRTIPPLRYDDVHRLKRERPNLSIEINGGLVTLDEVAEQLQAVDAVMIGRAAYDDPMGFADADARFFTAVNPGLDRFQVVEAMVPYVAEHLAQGGKLHHVTRHMLTLFRRQPGGKKWRQLLSSESFKPDQDETMLLNALEVVRQAHERRAAAA